MEKIKSLAHTSFDEIFEAFSAAFQDYVIQLNRKELHTMITRRGFNKELSFGAFDGDRLVSFTLNGIGKYRGKHTAYDTGTGTISEYKGKGLATKVFMYSLPHLQNAKVSQYLLEVLQHNSAAVSVYRKVGFKVSREFGYYVMQTNNLRNTISPGKHKIVQLDIAAIESLRNFFDFEPSWQNSFSSVKRNLQSFIIMGVNIKGEIAGFGVFEPKSGDITQLAVKPEFRRMGIGTGLLYRMAYENKHSEIKMINTDLSCASISLFMKANGIELSGKQFEMTRAI